jgi:hypothetical protein
MTIILYAGGFLIGVAGFLYVTSLLRDASEKAGKKIPSAKPKANDGMARKLFFGHLTADEMKPGLRMCPCCRKELARDEPLYASKAFCDGDNKILIHGCAVCYKYEKTIN